MTPVATPVALSASSWDAALEETLSGGSRAQPHSTGPVAVAAGTRGAVHSVHGRVVNLCVGDGLIALAHESLDDAPWTVRLHAADWSALSGARVGDDVRMTRNALSLSGGALVRVLLAPDGARSLTPDAGVPVGLPAALAVLDGVPSPAASTPFGALAADALSVGIRRLTRTARALLDGEPDAAEATTAAALRLLGLGEGLTPSGDDVLSGLAFVAAHPGFGLTALRHPLRLVAESAEQRTTLLSAVTLRAALEGRARARLHDLVGAIIAGDERAMHRAAAHTAEIGHTSGYDLLTGIRLGVVLALDIPRPSPFTEGDHR